MRIKIQLSVLLVLLIVGVLPAQNYVKTYTAREAKKTSLSGTSNTDAAIETTQYFDELGRPLQSVVRKGSPNSRDVVSGVIYDANGRAHKTYLPYEATAANSGNFRSAWLTEIGQFYDNTQNDVVDESTYFYSEEVFEQSILNRPVSAFGPGSQWRQSDNEKPVTFKYRVNNVTDAIADITASANGRVSHNGVYAVGVLTVTIFADENGHQTLEFVDGLGKTVCKKVQSGTNTFYSTYYVYDDFDQLTMVVPPQAVKEANANWEEHLNNVTFRKDWLFTYQYDHRQRMIEKQVPGADPVYMVYDNRDRLVLTQDGNMRGENYEYIEGDLVLSNGYQGKSYILAPDASFSTGGYFEVGGEGGEHFSAGSGELPNTQWLFTKYDYLNRPVITGLVNLTGTIAEIRAQVAAVTDFEIKYIGAEVLNSTDLDLFGYDKTGFPAQLAEADVLSVTYYDNYEFRDDFTWGSNYAATGYQTAVMGQVSGALTRKIGGDMLKSISYYDSRIRPIISITENHLGGNDRITTTYANIVTPRVDQTVRVHSTSSTTKTITESFVYDHMDRLVSVVTDIDGNVTRTDHQYNAIGELKTKNLNATQLVDYDYNIRGWMTKINGGTSFNDANDKFGMELQYTAAGQYNGNIGKMRWKTNTPQDDNSAQTFDYTYDHLSRLKKAIYNQGLSGAGKFDVGRAGEGIQYDANGNITTMERYYNGTIADDLTYAYNKGNQLTSVADASSLTNFGFEETGSEGLADGEYIYDRNGNMTADANKGISNIVYNYLDLPEAVTVPEGTIYYTYDAAGIKLRKFFDKNTGADETTDYVGGMHYKDNALQFVQTAEGRFQFATNKYQYDLTDHLGNVRVTVEATRDNGNVQNFSRPQQECVSNGEQTFTIITNPASGILDISLDITNTFGVGETNITIYEGAYELASLQDIFGTGTVHNVSFGELLLSGRGDVKVKLGEAGVARSSCMANVQASITPVITEAVQKDDYYPFGLTFNHWNSTIPENRYKLSGNEEQPEIPNVSDFNARFYDAALGRFMMIDPLADVIQESWNPYHYNYDNPISFVDPSGLFSTHTDSTGNVIAVYDDGDLGVYRHDDATSQEDVDKKREESGTTSGNGEHMGETQFWDEFMDVDIDGNLTGKIIRGARIEFGESWDDLIAKKHRKASKMSLGRVAMKSTKGGEFDLKAKRGNGAGRLLNGYYTTARSAGNYLAGLNAAGRGISFEKFMNIAGSLHRNGKYGAALTALMPHHNAYGGVFRGEHAYAGRMIMQGWFNNSEEVSYLTVYSLFIDMKKSGELENRMNK